MELNISKCCTFSKAPYDLQIMFNQKMGSISFDRDLSNADQARPQVQILALDCKLVGKL